MIFTDIMGGLGNQLFQIFTTLAYEIQTGTTAVFPYSIQLGESNSGVTKRYTYWDTIFKQIKHKTTFSLAYPQKENEEKKKWICYREQGFHYTPIPTDVRHDFQIYGYFQSWKYFHNYASQIVQELNLASLQEGLLSKYPGIRFTPCRIENAQGNGEKWCKEDTRISMHFRLGDYKTKQEYHPVMPFDYYQTALEKCLNELNHRGIRNHQISVLYFCEDEDDDFVVSERVGPLKVVFPTVRFSRVLSSLTDWEQLLVMANSHHHIIANSSFSWWGAYLANLLLPHKNNDYPLVYYPSKWFGPAMSSISTEDLCPPYWNRVSVI